MRSKSKNDIVSSDGTFFAALIGPCGGTFSGLEPLTNLVGVTAMTLRDLTIPEGTYTIPDGVVVHVVGQLKCETRAIILIGSNTRVVGFHGNVIENVCFQIAPTAKNSSIKFCNFVGNDVWVPGTTYYDGIWLLSSSTRVPENCEVAYNTAKRCWALYSVYGARGCRFVGNTSIGCHWGFYVSSSNGSTFQGNSSVVDDRFLPIEFQLPTVAFLNMPISNGLFSETQNTRRGITGNVFLGNTIDGWNEEGFSFDGNSGASMLASGKVSSANSTSITINSAYAAIDWQGLSAVFNTGALRGRRFRIISSSAHTLTLNEFGNYYTLASAGDFITIELPCHGNVVSSNTITGTGDNDAVELWGFGAETLFSDNTIRNGGRVTVQGMNNNEPGSVWSYAPHNISFINNKFSEASFLSSKLSIVVTINTDRYDPLLVGNESVLIGQMVIQGVKVERDNGYPIALNRVGSAKLNYVTNDDIFGQQSISSDPTFRIENRLSFTDSQLTNIVPAKNQEIINNEIVKRYSGTAWVAI